MAVQCKRIKHKVSPNSFFDSDSKLLSSLLDNNPYLERVCNRLDTRMPSVGDYRDVCSYYGIDSYQVIPQHNKFRKDKQSKVFV